VDSVLHADVLNNEGLVPSIGGPKKKGLSYWEWG